MDGEIITSSHLDTEAGALQNIVEWSQDRPMWQRDALRRLCRVETLDETDYSELLEIAKGNEATAQPIKQEHVPATDGVYSTVNLKSIRESEHVNALEPGETLSFEKGAGITVIYGDNGSGKSGYARILKNACRARMNAKDKQDIRPNIYDQNPGIPKATVNFSINDQNQSAEWVQHTEADPRLSAISVFDSNTANVHVDEENDVAYTPFPLELLRRLSDACSEMTRRIKAEISALEKQTPEAIKNPKCDVNTEVGRIISLKKDTPKSKIEALASLTDEESDEYKTLKEDLAADPEKAVRKLVSSKSKLKEIMEELQLMIHECTDKKIEEIQNKGRVFSTRKAAAKAAADELFKDDQADDVLPNLGADAWRSLWNAARLYSEQDAYPEQDFPHTNDGAKCVLCQQDLSPEAAKRLNSFEDFVKDEAKRQEDEARKNYRDALHALKSKITSVSKIHTAYKDIRDHIGDEELARAYKQNAIRTKWRIRNFLRDKAGDVMFLPDIGVLPYSKSALEAIQKRIDDLTAEKDSPKRLAMVQRYQELKDRTWLGVIKDDILAELVRVVRRETLNKILNDTRTNTVTSKSSDLAKHLVTDALRAEFSKEVSKLELGDLAVELRHAKSTSGTPLFRVSLTRKPTEKKISAILSEGEFRCIALAAFLAEQATTESKSTIVFDDPVCSLDHMHREQVADRLAVEGKDRQVVVFTHDLAFLFLLQRSCEKYGTNLAHRSVLKAGEKVGLCKPEAPLRAQNVEKALTSLENDLANKKRLYENGDHMQWAAAINHYQRELRNLWERAVEEAISPVVKRLQNKINIGGLEKITEITMEDYEFVKQGYGRCSELLHSDGDDLNRSLPKPERIQREIESIRDWIKSIKNRQN